MKRRFALGLFAHLESGFIQNSGHFRVILKINRAGSKQFRRLDGLSFGQELISAADQAANLFGPALRLFQVPPNRFFKFRNFGIGAVARRESREDLGGLVEIALSPVRVGRNKRLLERCLSVYLAIELSLGEHPELCDLRGILMRGGGV